MSTPWGQGRIEVSNSREEILKGLAAERAIKSIYDDLMEANQVSIAYTNFRLHVKKIQNFRGFREGGRSSSWGQARAEVIMLRGRIRAGLANGRPLKSIYDELKAEGRISGSYIGFYKNVKKFCGSPKTRGSKPQPVIHPVRPEASAAAPPLGAAPRATPQSPPTAPVSPAPTKTFADEHPRCEPVFKRNKTITLEEMI